MAIPSPDYRLSLKIHQTSSFGSEALNLRARERIIDTGPTSSGAVLLVHGSTLSSILFDVPIDGPSWLERIALSGRRGFAMDFRGFGYSDRPASMLDDVTPAVRPVNTADGVADLKTMLDYILAQDGIDYVDVMGFSWGSVVLGAYLAEVGTEARIRRGAFFAPLYACVNEDWLNILGDAEDQRQFTSALGASRKTTFDALVKRWNIDIRATDPETVRPKAVLDAIWQSSIETDPHQTLDGAPAFRVPNGAFQDMHRIYSGQSVFKASKIKIPSLVLRSSQDSTSTREDALRLYGSITAVKKQYHEIGEGGHLACAEHGAEQIFRVIADFMNSQS